MAARRPSAPDSASARVHVPKLNQDFVWSLRQWPATVSVAGKEWSVPAMPAADWVAAILAGDLVDLLMDVLEPEDGEDLTRALAAGTVELNDLQDVILDLVATVGARPWWVVFRLVSVAQSNWDVLGAELILKGVDADRLSLSAWLDAVLLTALRNMEQKETTMFTMRLEQPPPEMAAEVAEDLEMSRDAFLSMAG